MFHCLVTSIVPLEKLLVLMPLYEVDCSALDAAKNKSDMNSKTVRMNFIH